MRALLTLEIAPRLGIVLFRPGRELMSLFYHSRVLIETVPDHLKKMPSGMIPAARQPLAEAAGIVSFLCGERVIPAAGGLETLEAGLLRGSGCQYPAGDYHHHEMVTLRHTPGSLRVCWSCDNRLRDHFTDLLADIARRNVTEFVVTAVLRDLGFDNTHVLTLPELCWWALRHDLAGCIPDAMARCALGMPPEDIPSVTRECDTVPVVPASRLLQEKVRAAEEGVKGRRKASLPALDEKPVRPVMKLAVDPESPASFMLRPKRRRQENQAYTRWVKTQPCEVCRAPADDPHHITGHGLSGMATKAHDLFVFPLCRVCHDMLHSDVQAFERQYGTQPELLLRFLDRTLGTGIIITV